MERDLNRPFTKEEVGRALKQMGPLKSPSLDGFGHTFIKTLEDGGGQCVCSSAQNPKGRWYDFLSQFHFHSFGS